MLAKGLWRSGMNEGLQKAVKVHQIAFHPPLCYAPDMSEPLFRTDPYAREASAVVVEAAPGRIVLDAALFYPRGGGQPGDRGELLRADGSAVAIADAAYDADRAILLFPAE